MQITELLSTLGAEGSSLALTGCLLGAFAILVFAPLIYLAVFSKGAAADRLELLIRAWREPRNKETDSPPRRSKN